MPHQPREFINGEIYHIVLKRIGKGKLFRNIDDYYRGVFCIYEFNTTKPITIRQRRIARARFKRYIKETYSGQSSAELPIETEVVKKEEVILMKDSRDLLVEVLAFCLMPDHIHLLLRQLKEGGISKFMLKLGSGYAVYYQRKYKLKAKGHFFQDRFTAVHIKTEDQLRVVFVYIHTNPVSLIEPYWKEKGIKNPERLIEFLEEKYRWSSFFDYIAKKNFPSVTNRKFMLEIMGNENGCKKAVEDWIRYKGEIREFSNLSLE